MKKASCIAWNWCPHSEHLHIVSICSWFVPDDVCLLLELAGTSILNLNSSKSNSKTSARILGFRESWAVVECQPYLQNLDSLSCLRSFKNHSSKAKYISGSVISKRGFPIAVSLYFATVSRISCSFYRNPRLAKLISHAFNWFSSRTGYILRELSSTWPCKWS